MTIITVFISSLTNKLFSLILSEIVNIQTNISDKSMLQRELLEVNTYLTTKFNMVGSKKNNHELPQSGSKE